MKKFIELFLLAVFISCFLFMRALGFENPFDEIFPIYFLSNLVYFFLAGKLFRTEPVFRFQTAASHIYAFFLCLISLLGMGRVLAPYGFSSIPFLILLSLILVCPLVLTIVIRKRTQPPYGYLRAMLIRFAIVLSIIVPILLLNSETRLKVFHNPESLTYKIAQIEISREQAKKSSTDYNSAAINLSSVLNRYQSLSNKPEYQRGMADWGYFLYMNGDCSKADSILNTVIVNHFDEEAYIDGLYYSGLMFSSIGNYQKSDSVFAILLKDYPEETRPRIHSINYRLANNAKGLGLYTKADSSYKSLIASAEYKNDIGISFYIHTRREYAGNYLLMGDYTNAALELEDLLAYTQKEQPDVFFETLILSDIAHLYQVQGDYKEAIKRSDIALAKNKEEFYSPYFRSIATKASALMALSKFKEAEDLLNKAVKMIEQNNIAQEESAVLIYNALFDLMMVYENYDRAARHLNHASDVLITKYGNKSINLSASYCRTGELQFSYNNLEEADFYYSYGLQLMREYGSSHTLNYWILANNYSRIFIHDKNYTEAKKLLDATESRIKNYIQPDHPEYAMILFNMGMNELINGSKEEAKKYLEQSKSIVETALGVESIKYADVLVALALTDKTKAKEYHQQALVIYNTVLPAGHSKIKALTN